MANAINIYDLIGKVFSRLTIIEEAERYCPPNGKKERRALCKCTCGNTTIKTFKDLKKGTAKSCGCINKEKEVDILKENTYGDLTIIKELDKYVSPSGHESRKVLCKCICGKEKSYFLHNIRKGKVTDCGCIIKIHKKKTEINKLNIEKHNNSHDSNWKIVKQISAVRDEKGNVKRIVLAKCSCGVEKEMYIENISSSNGCSTCAIKIIKEKRLALKTDEERALDRSARTRYSGMIRRCYNENAKDYKNYGARGITMCDEWRNNSSTFYKWCKDNGMKLHLEIDRKDNNGNYTPDNCRFVTRSENNRNQERTILDWDKVNKIRSYEYDRYTDKELSEMFGGSADNIRSVRNYNSWVK